METSLLPMPEWIERVDDRAMAFAKIAHWGQINEKNGEEFISHPERVYTYLNTHLSAMQDEFDHHFDREIVSAVAWLHDVVEDTWATPDILSVLFPHEVVHAVMLLTRTESLHENDYYGLIKANPIALAVKTADLIDNTSPARMGVLPTATRERLETKYRKAAQCLGVETFLSQIA